MGAILSGAAVTTTDVDTGITRNATTNSSGLFSFAGLNPGRYTVHVRHSDFADVEVTDITLNVADKRQLEIKLPVGTSQQTVTVNGGSETINTTDATVGVVIGRQFVEEIPLNGRSFGSLILLSPGALTASPQGNDFEQGSFSVNGQRTDGNNYMLDGASANIGGWMRGSSAVSAGMYGSVTALGTTQAITSVDALQEFRVATSTYSAEYGRSPGAQISFQSRSGTNAYHGTAFDYLRNAAFDANNWFNDYATPAFPKPQERQNDFGGVLGGPLTVPKVYSGKDRAFFFFSYEGLRLTQPTAATVFYVPSNGTYNTATYPNPLYKNLRANAPAALQSTLNAFPLPNCSVSQDEQCVDYGDGLSPYLFSAFAPSSIDAIMARVDFQPLPWLHVFARYSDTNSQDETYYSGGPDSYLLKGRTRAYLLGANSVFRASLTNELRLQYAPSYYFTALLPDSLGGAQPVNLMSLQGLPPSGGETLFGLLFPSEAGRLYQVSYGGHQFQPNAVDNISWAHGSHIFKAGVDYRQTTAYLADGALSNSPDIIYYFESADNILQNLTTNTYVSTFLRQDPTTKNLGIFFQDEWRLRPRVSLSLGLRWDLNPAPSVSGAQQYTYTGNINNPSSMALSRLGAPLYKTTYTDFAPRFGIAVTLHGRPGHETVFRGGAGLFYDTGQALEGTFGSGSGLGTASNLNIGSGYGPPQGFPLSANTILTPIPPVTAPYALGSIAAPNLIPPSTIQWSASLEQALGQSQSFILGYVGSQGRNLVVEKEYNLGNLNPLFSDFSQYQNGPGSVYNALQLQYKRRALRDLQVQAAYTWSHAIDSESTDFGVLALQRGNSDHDVRNNFTSALVYNVPTQYEDRWQRSILGNWALSLWFITRSAFPVQVDGATLIDPVSGNEYTSQLNYNDENPYVHEPGIPGGRQFNPAVLSVPLASQNGNGDSPRNFLRGFGETEADVAIQRTFPLAEQLHLQFRAEAFNVFNHPNFGALNVDCGTNTPGAVCTNPLLGQATGTLSNASSQTGSAAPIYQQGGPRSLQLALKLQF